MNDAIGFPQFHKSTLQELGPLLIAARTFLQIGHDMMSTPVSGSLPDLAKQVARMVANSMESVILLVCNGCGIDALRITRTMFEAAITIHYLDSHPELVEDYLDFVWVIRKKHYDYHSQLPTAKVKPTAPETICEMLERYEQVKARFTDKNGRIRNSWCKASLKQMAEETGAQSIYGGIYPFGSSLIHTNVLAVVAGADQSVDVEPVPSKTNIRLALQTAVLSYALLVTAFDKIASLGRGDILESAFARFENASQ